MFRSAPLIIILCLAAAFVVPANASAKTHPLLRVNPNKVAINHHATIVGKHLWPNMQVTLVLAVPALVKNAAERFIGGIERTNKNGYLKLSTRMPVVTKCGKATVYVAPFRQQKGKTAVVAHIKLIGCKAGKRGAPPPVP